MKTETKEFKFTLTEVDEALGTFKGYASIWDAVDSYGDQVVKGAFKKTLKDRKKFPMLWSHKVDEPIGVIAGVEDDKGLAVEGQLNLDVPRATWTRSLMKQGAIEGLSIGYQTVVEELDKATGTRKLKEIKLWEISPVVFQACPGATVDAVKGEGIDAEDLYAREAEAPEAKGPEKSTLDGGPQPDSAGPDQLHLATKLRDTLAETFQILTKETT